LKKQWCIPEVGAEFVWRMEDVLDLYEEPYDPEKPVVCFDELPYQMVAQMRTPIPAKPGRPAPYDYEYERRGTANLFAISEPKACWRHLDVTDRRTAIDFAHQMRAMVEEHYPHSEKVRVVLNNLNTHTPAALYRTFEPEEARRILRRLELHHTPKHGSWLNQVELEFSVLCRQCLSGHIPDKERLSRESGAWEQERNAGAATVHWRFTSEDARKKLERLYPSKP
jgi:DDE superfamily endonuclease